MKPTKIFILLLISSLTISCFKDDDDYSVTANQINDFVWKGMNFIYLYKDEVPDLANNRFSSNTEYANFLNSFSSPSSFFENLIHQRQTVDRFSWITDNYIALEASFNGISISNGMEFQLHQLPNYTIFGVVTQVHPNTSAKSQGVKRGDIFYGIDDIPLTANNYIQLLNKSSYTINIGTYEDNNTPETNDDSITQTLTSFTLTKSQYTENPIFINKVLTINNKKVGYLMYNSFTGTDQFNNELNNVFGTFKNEAINDLVLDLRYNSGGSVNTAIYLASMITGQFTGDIFSTEQWNDEFQNYFENENPEFLINRFVDNINGNALNSLNLSKVYILTTNRSASASELVINCLKPYIQVIQIGATTAGKYQASTTLYDSPDFSKKDVNPKHTYAIQPLILKSLNVNGVTDYFNGIAPTIEITEQVNNLGVLGDENERLLAEALSEATGMAKKATSKTQPLKLIHSSDAFKNGMYVKKEFNLTKDSFLE